MLCGPSESLLIADETADPWRLAIDLLNEAEHGTDSAATLVTDSLALAEAVDAAVAEQIIRDHGLPRPQSVTAAPGPSVGPGRGPRLVGSMDRSGRLFANTYAAERQIAACPTPAAGRPWAVCALRRGLLGQDTDQVPQAIR